MGPRRQGGDRKPSPSKYAAAAPARPPTSADSRRERIRSAVPCEKLHHARLMVVPVDGTQPSFVIGDDPHPAGRGIDGLEGKYLNSHGLAPVGPAEYGDSPGLDSRFSDVFMVLANHVRKPLDDRRFSSHFVTMDLDHDACYRAVCQRDPRFDGRFFTGVKTTGIYCRPICPARRRDRRM